MQIGVVFLYIFKLLYSLTQENINPYIKLPLPSNKSPCSSLHSCAFMSDIFTQHYIHKWSKITKIRVDKILLGLIWWDIITFIKTDIDASHHKLVTFEHVHDGT